MPTAPARADAPERARAGAALSCAALALPIWFAGAHLEGRAPAADPALLLAAWIAVSALIVAGLRGHPYPRFGPANALTALRAAATLLLAAVALDPTPGLVAAATGAGLAILALDGLDGALARRTGLASAFGARFDVEVDAALTLALSVLAWRAGPAGPEILALAAPYYAFSLLRTARPRFGRPLPPSLARKAVCVAQVGTPLLLVALPVAPGAASLLVWACLGAILSSFARDLAWLAQDR